MTSLSLVLLAIFTAFNPSYSLETDNFLTWGIELEDSADDVNKYINEHIETELTKINTRPKPLTCEKVRNKLIVSFRGFITHPMEHWLEANLGPRKVFPDEASVTEAEYFAMSIYATKKFDVSKFYSLSRNININGIYIGTDKLSHWMSTGERYYRKYAKGLKKGMTEEEAYKYAINYGIFLDRYVLGGISSGVFSFGDLEANFQGMLLNKGFCRLEEDKNYLKLEDGQWKMQRKIDVRDYINPNWDETYNPSLFSFLKWDMVKENFLKSNCKKIATNVHQSRFDYYRSIEKQSFSFRYIEGLKVTGRRLPKFLDRNYKNICP